MASPTMSAPSRGSTTRPRPSASKTTATSKPAPPKPPSASLNSAPITPSSANCCQISGLKPWADRAMRSRLSKLYCSAMKRFRLSASMRRSSVCSKFMSEPLQSQDHLGDDVFLDFVGAAEDRQLAVVEVLGRRRRGVVGADRHTLESFFQRLGDKGPRIRPHCPAYQRGDFLPDLGAAD